MADNRALKAPVRSQAPYHCLISSAIGLDLNFLKILKIFKTFAILGLLNLRTVQIIATSNGRPQEAKGLGLFD